MYVQYRLAATLCCADMKLLGGFLKVINPTGGVNFPGSFLEQVYYYFSILKKFEIFLI